MNARNKYGTGALWPCLGGGGAQSPGGEALVEPLDVLLSPGDEEVPRVGVRLQLASALPAVHYKPFCGNQYTLMVSASVIAMC